MTNDARQAGIRSAILPSLALLALVAIGLGAVCTCGFVNFDDSVYVTANGHVQDGLSVAGLRWAFTSTEALNWHPLTWVSLQIDFELFGLAPWGYHLTNLLLHAANSVLLFLVFWRMTGAVGRSWLLAALFALHPLHVESVAWISERKDVLSTFFGMFGLLAYTRYVEQPRLSRYALVLVGLLLSLMAKPMLVTFPCLLLLLDFWPLRRLNLLSPGGETPASTIPAAPSSFRLILLEKVPLLVLAALSSVMTVIAQRSGGAIETLEELPWRFRFENALVSYVQYLIQTFWPLNLAPFYPHPRTALPGRQAVAAAAALLVISTIAVLYRRRWPYWLVGWLWYLGTMVPVIGLVQVGEQARADRYTYFPLIGIFLIIVWGIADILARRPLLLYVRWLLAAAAVSIALVLSWRQVRYWHDSEALWRQALDVAADNAIARNNMGHAILQAHGEPREAERHLRQALQFKPGYGRAWANLGVALAQQDRTDETIAAFERALEIHPNMTHTRNNLGLALAKTGRTDAAIDQFRQTIAYDPGWAEPQYNLAFAFGKQQRWAEALPYARECARLEPRNAQYRFLLARLLTELGQHEEAQEQILEAERLRRKGS
ncbi:MAG TPA: tetratricopeptide repeat protein [Gemmataceae bacterium]|nr:tetratricopeptide repeat protein [Gemmataceae bacterium]